MKLKIGFLLLLALIISGCTYYNEVLPADAVELTVSARPFYTASEYEVYFNSDQLEERGNTVRIDVQWSVKAPKLRESLYYAPYIAIVPVDSGWTYLGSHQNIPPLTGNRTGVKKDVLERVLANDDTDWENIDTIGIHTRAKSFGQGFATFAFSKSGLHPDDTPQFKIYLIYYDREEKTGWYKVLLHEANLAGLLKE